MQTWSIITRAPRRVATLALVLLLALTALGAWPSRGFSLAATVSADPTCPSPWTCTDIGNPTPSGSQIYNNGTWQISGGGPLFEQTGEQDRFVSQPLIGDGSISGHVISQAFTTTISSNYNARAGLMWRETTANPSDEALADFYSIYATPGNGLMLKYRDKALQSGDQVVQLRPWPDTMPLYFKVTRSGDTFASYLSHDGVNWAFIPESAFIMPGFGENAQVGMFVNSNSATSLNTATFDGFQMLPAYSGTFSDNIASVGGSSSYSFIPSASGPLSVGSCAVTNGYTYTVSLADSTGSIGSGGTGAATCNYATATVSAGSVYTVTTTAISGTGAYRSAWNVNSAPVVWSLSNIFGFAVFSPTVMEPPILVSVPYSITVAGGSQSVSFPALSNGQIALSTCGPAGSDFNLYLKSASNAILASSTAASNCQALTYTPTAPGLFRLVETSPFSDTGPWSGTITTELPGGGPPPPTNTPTNTPIPGTPTNTAVPNTPTNTAVPNTPTNTAVPPTPTKVPATPTSVPPTAVPATATTAPVIPPTSAPVSAPNPPAPSPTTSAPAPSPTALSSGCAANGAVPLSLRTNQGTLYSGDTLRVNITTAALAHGTLTLQVTTTKTIVKGKGAQRKHVKETVVLYRVSRQGTANSQGRITDAIHLTYQPDAPVHAALWVKTTTACSSATRHGTLTITPLFTTHLSTRSLVSGRSLAVKVQSLARATVNLSLAVTKTTIVTKGSGKHITHSKRITVLYRLSGQGTANKKGAFTGNLHVTYKPHTSVQATLTVTVHAGHRSTTQTMTITVQPPHGK